MAKVAQPRKTSKLDIIIYSVVIAIVLILAWVLGAAMDYAVTSDGSIDFNQLGKGFNIVTSNPSLIFSAIKVENSYAPKMLFMGILAVSLYIAYKFTEDKKRLHRKGVEHGSAKWGDEKEMKSLADSKEKPYLQPIMTSDGKRVFDKNGDFVGVIIDNNLLLTKEVYLSLNSHQHFLNLNILIIGGSGSGKTRFFAKPNIMQLNTSYVVTDPKGEILQSTGKMLKEAGYEVRIFNLIEMQHSNNYNPFHYVFDHNGNLSEDNIKKMVNVLFKSTKGDGEKDDFWSQKGQTMLEALVYLLFEESEYNAKLDKNGKIIPETRDFTHLNFFSVTEKMRKLRYPPSGGKQPDGFFMEKEENETEEAFNERRSKAFLCPLDKDFIELEKHKPDALALRLYKEVRNAPEETGQSFLSSANVKTFMFNMSNLRNLTCCDNIELEKLGDRKTALFIIISATDSTYNFLAAMMYTQLFDTLANRANFKYGGVLPVHVRCIMDEFSNIGQIPDFDKVIAFVRSMGMSLNVIIQNLAQLKAKYEKTWEVITGNCDTLLFLGGKEESTLKYISEALGKETIDVTGKNKTSGGKQKSTSENNSILGRELMQQNEISTMPISDCIVMIRSHNPFYCTKYPIDKHPNYKFLEDANKDNKFDVSTVKSVTVEEFIKANKPKENVDTNINISAPDTTEKEKIQSEQDIKIDTFFKHDTSDYEVTSEPLELDNYEEAEMFGGLLSIEAVSEKFAEDTPKYGDIAELDKFDLGEPIAEREEVLNHDETDENNSNIISINEETEDVLQYGDIDEDAETIENIENFFAEANTFTDGFSPEAELFDENEFAMNFDTDF